VLWYCTEDSGRRSKKYHLNYWGVHPVARVSSNVNKPPYATMFGARFYCALTLHVLTSIGGHLQVQCDINVATLEYIVTHST
jgi:hypothetical protein